MVKASHPDVVATEDPAAKLAGLRYKFSDFDGVEHGRINSKTASCGAAARVR